MSNRKKVKNNRLRMKKPGWMERGLIARSTFPTHDEAIANPDIIGQVDIPEDIALVIKTVPAKVDGTVVGTAYLHDDGSVAVKFDADAPQWALDKIKATEQEVGYSLEMGGPTDGTS